MKTEMHTTCPDMTWKWFDLGVLINKVFCSSVLCTMDVLNKFSRTDCFKAVLLSKFKLYGNVSESSSISGVNCVVQGGE